ncbi:MAG: ATP-binding protein [Candidatus Brockarchaeota archaeon]|nr:ATP-binding protein [Candidatus Brockarchaeota archaeon]MBO3808979.1 ATP-binding protein [Candidatus Brockarchaeota archaeon]
MIVRFVNRNEELSTLNTAYTTEKAGLIIVYGRRRVGKTRLLLEFLKDKNGLYFYTPRGSEEVVLSEFSKTVEKEFFNGFRFHDFRSFLEYLSKKFEEKTIVVIDEFQRLSEIDGAISLIQRFWDEKFSEQKGMLILSGSSIGTIRRIALRGDSPLYGRRTLTLDIKPLKFLDLREWFSKYSPEDLVKVYAAFGGTPAYLEKIDENKTPEENIVGSILSKDGALHDEPEYLLLEELRVPNRYMDILTAISLGKCYLSEISDFTKIKRENLTTYLTSLENLDLISREQPVLVEKRKTRYVITDPFFECWFRFVNPNKTALELGLEEKVWNNITGDFNAYLGRVFEKISGEYVISEIKSGGIEVDADVFGRWQYGEEEIDLIAYSSKEKKGLLLEVKWKDLSYEEAKNTILKLIEKGRSVKMNEKKYGIIAKKVSDKEELSRDGYFIKELKDMVP